jgi:hypothetical protein
MTGDGDGSITGWIADVDAVTYEALLQDIPLAFHGSMPERIESARFPGHDSPVSAIRPSRSSSSRSTARLRSKPPGSA